MPAENHIIEHCFIMRESFTQVVPPGARIINSKSYLIYGNKMSTKFKNIIFFNTPIYKSDKDILFSSGTYR